MPVDEQASRKGCKGKRALDTALPAVKLVGMFQVQEADLSNQATRDLLALHLRGMHANSPADSVFALDLTNLQAPGITVWTVGRAGDVAGVGALKALDDGTGEVKSMRTHPDFLRQGVAAILLEHIIVVAQARRYRRLSLETGSGPVFEPALTLYRKRGFANGGAFDDYAPSDFNQFLHLEL